MSIDLIDECIVIAASQSLPVLDSTAYLRVHCLYIRYAHYHKNNID